MERVLRDGGSAQDNQARCAGEVEEETPGSTSLLWLTVGRILLLTAHNQSFYEFGIR